MAFFSARIFSLFLIFLWAAIAQAKETPRHALSPAEAASAREQNDFARRHPSVSDETVLRPYAEYETAGFVLFNDESDYESGAIKDEIARHLPAGVKLIILSQSEEGAQKTRHHFGRLTSSERVYSIPANVNTDTFWARDTSPEPVFVGSASSTALGLVETRHRNGQLIAPYIVDFLKVSLTHSDYAYPGGNFIADTRGNCFSVEGPIKENDMRTLYGCKRVVQFRYRHGIGHVDETLKLLSDNVALTDESTYVETLKSVGYTVYQLPRPSGHPHGTYANSLLVNGTLFLPVYGVAEDQQAINIYRQQGLLVYPLASNELSGSGLGSIHCITMSYPQTDPQTLLALLRSSR